MHLTNWVIIAINKIRGYRIVAITTGFQPVDAGSIPATRSKIRLSDF